MAQAVSLSGAALAQEGVPTRDGGASATIVFAVENMHCGNCMRTVEQTLTALPGVEAARVNLSAKRVSVRMRATPRAAEPVIAALVAKGFPATVLVEAASESAAAAGKDLLRRLGVAGFAAANIMLLSVSVWSGHSGDMPSSLRTLFCWLSALIALPAVAYAGQPFFKSAWLALAARRVNMDVPISLGVILATTMSLYQTVRGSEQVYFDAAVTLLFFLLVGRALDQAVRARAASAAENLLGKRVTTASVMQSGGGVERIAIASVLPGMRLVVAAGEQVPVDGRILQGTASIDESIVTGESRPRSAGTGDTVHGGSVALTGPFEMIATSAADDSLLADIARLMQTAEQARGRYVRLADRAARLYAPMVHLLAATTFIGWMATGAGWEAALTAAIAVLIITCPCALALAVPVVQVIATSRLFRSGVVLKSADALDRIAEADAIVFDKTGTLTLGRPELAAPEAVSQDDLRCAASLAAHSRHPYAQAVVRAARQRGIVVEPGADVAEHAGAGLEAAAQGTPVRLGSAAFCGVAADSGQQSLWLKRGDAAPVALPLVDRMRPDAVATVRMLQRRGYMTEVLSGDAAEVVRAASAAVGIERWAAAQRPEQKIDRIGELAREGRKVLMVGDGLNDAPSLAAGHASLTPSSAIDISQMAADGVFLGDRLGAVARVLDVARQARRRALENFGIAIAYNAVFVPLAVTGHVTPLIAAIAMSASSIAVTLNSLRIFIRDGEDKS